MQPAKRKPGRQAGQPPPLPDIVGQRFGDLEVLAFIGVSGKRRLWRCKCLCVLSTGEVCGRLRVVETAALNRMGARRCRKCNGNTLRRGRMRASTWMYR